MIGFMPPTAMARHVCPEADGAADPSADYPQPWQYTGRHRRWNAEWITEGECEYVALHDRPSTPVGFVPVERIA